MLLVSKVLLIKYTFQYKDSSCLGFFLDGFILFIFYTVLKPFLQAGEDTMSAISSTFSTMLEQENHDLLNRIGTLQNQMWTLEEKVRRI